MLEILKPTKAKLIGTVLLIVVDWITSFITGQISGFFIPDEMVEILGPAFQEALMASLVDFLIVGLIVMVIEFVLKLILFYVAVSIIIEKLK